MNRLRQILAYNQDTGEFLRVERTSNRTRVGDTAGWKITAGYQVISLDGQSYRRARLAWFYMTGAWPKDEIDHIDGDVSNDRWNNLREATHQQNSHNRKRHRDNKSGYKGVHKRGNKWKAHIAINGKCQYLGSFDDPLAAYNCYLKKAKELFGKFVREE